MSGLIDMATLVWTGKFDGAQLNTGLNNAQKQVNTTKKGFGGLSNFISKTLMGSVLGLSGGLAGMATMGVKSALDLQNSMKMFQAQTGMSTAEVDKVKDAVKNMYVATGRSYDDLTSMAAKMHNQLGMGAGDITKYEQGWVNFGKVSKQSDDQVIEGVTGIKNAWHLSSSQIQPVLDKLIFSNQKYGLSVQEGESSLRTLAPAFTAVGMNVNQAISYLDLFKKAGLDSSSATSAFRIALTKVKSPAELQNIITKMQQTKDDTARAQLGIEYFGKSGVQMAAALKPGSTSLADIQKSLNNAGNAANNAAKALGNGNLTVALAKVKRESQQFLESVGEKALPSIQKFVSYLNTNMPKIQSSLSGAFTVGGKALNLFASAVSGALNHTKLLSPIIAGAVAGFVSFKVISKVSGLLKTFTSNSLLAQIATKGLGAAIKANPLGFAITVIQLAVTAGVALYENWGTITKWAGKLKSSIKTHFSDIKKDVGNAWDSVKTKTSETWDKVKSSTEKGLSNIKSKIQENGGGIKGTIKTFVDGYKQVWDTGFSALNTITGGRLGEVVRSVEKKMSEIHKTISGWKKHIQDVWNKIWDFKLPHIKLPHFNISGKFSLDPPSMPDIGVKWYGTGGIFNSPSVIGVGEKGQEAVLPISELSNILYNTLKKINTDNNNRSRDINPQPTYSIHVDKVVLPEDTHNAMEVANALINVAHTS